jgi:hypothetical protein
VIISNQKLDFEVRLREMMSRYEPGQSPGELLESKAQFLSENKQLEKENDELLLLVENYK